ncbi:MAG: MBL fold metallo-hydrolase [Actinomycetota bacterium]
MSEQMRPTLEIGQITVTALLDGAADAGPMADSFPGAPQDQALAYRDRYPGVFGANDGWHLIVRTWLIRAEGTLILVDTGIGRDGAPGPEWFGSNGRLLEELEADGVAPADVDTVVITHIHDDHLGGTVVAGKPAFPEARYVIQTADISWQRELATKSEEDHAFWNILLQPLEDAGLLHEIQGDAELVSGVRAQLMPGHTPGHQVVRVGSGTERLLISGDAFTHPMQLEHPDWTNVSDNDPAGAAASRRKLITELGSDPGLLIAPTHFEGPFGRVSPGQDGLSGWRSL